jgi:RNA 2',3'-cyclic 3'-phosphodiesterase
MYRLFAALALPEDIVLRLQGLCGGVPGAYWETPENLHLTLRFVGDVPGDVAEDIAYALASVRHEPFDLELAGVGHFSSGPIVRVLWAGLRKSDALLGLRARIEAALRRIDLPADGRRFIPHVTLAKLDDPSVPKVQEWLATNALFKAGPFGVERFALYSSARAGAARFYEREADYLLRA